VLSPKNQRIFTKRFVCCFTESEIAATKSISPSITNPGRSAFFTFAIGRKPLATEELEDLMDEQEDD
jgi:hypothetical protein